MEGSPADHPSAPTIDANHLQQGQPQNLTADPQHLSNNVHNGTSSESNRKPKGPSVRRACQACHAGKTRCSEVLPCQSCLKRGLGDSCAYPEPDAHDQPAVHHQVAGYAPQPLGYPPMVGMPPQTYYEYNTFTPAAAAATPSAAAPSSSAQAPPTPASTSASFRPAKRPRNLTEEETAAITRYTRGEFFIGTNQPVRIDPRLPVRLTLGEGDQVHFLIGHEQAAFPP